MSIDVLPVNETCNIKCTYCYEAGYAPKLQFDFPAVEKVLRSLNEPFALFGGEPLLAKREVLEQLWQLGIEMHGRNSVQTNGILITPELIQLFKRYRVNVGFSIDGPGELNAARCNLRLSEKANANLFQLLEEKVHVGLIITLTTANSDLGRRERLVEWLKKLDEFKVGQIRVHIMQRMPGCEMWVPTVEENVETLRVLHEAQKDFQTVRFDLFEDALKLQRGHDERVTCIWQACDPKHTKHVTSVMADGSVQGCQRILRGPKAERASFERQLILAERPQEDGGCQGCRFFVLCKGQCPATAIDGDVTKRSSDCEIWKSLLGWAEEALREVNEQPVSRRPDLVDVQSAMLEDWRNGLDTQVSFVTGRLQRRRARNGKPSGYSHTDTT